MLIFKRKNKKIFETHNLSIETMPSNSLEVMVGVFQHRALISSILSLKI